MYRRISIILTVLAALSFAPFAAHADSKGDAFAAKVASQLKELGYSTVEVSRTFLGRIRVEATGSAGEREIIFNPRTGEILRDFSKSGHGGLLTLPSGDGGEGGNDVAGQEGSDDGDGDGGGDHGDGDDGGDGGGDDGGDDSGDDGGDDGGDGDGDGDGGDD